jgi:5-oxoprolinase (ATP-hydrolysing) subunit B
VTAQTGVRILTCGDSALTVEFGEAVDPAVNDRVLALDAAVARECHPAITETIPTYRSLMVCYDCVTTGFKELSEWLRELEASLSVTERKGVRWRVPVVYGGEFGVDLLAVAAEHAMTPEELVARHSAAEYRVYMLGFMPGYTYLGGLDPEIATPRRAEPRRHTPAGTVSIGGMQTAIQCLAAPSGWHLLGRTPVRTYRPDRDPVFLMSPGDRISFYPVQSAEWDALDRAAMAGEPVAERLS